ncbi:MAG: FecR domain-containing protein [Nitrospira sp.]
MTHAAIQLAHSRLVGNARISDGRRPSGWRHVIAGAACMLALLSGAWYFDVLIRWQADYRTEVGERRTIRLPDQSVAMLNTGSAVALSFEGPMRRVRLLRGEASFKVQPDPDRPFIVEGAETATRAVGTEFVVRRHGGSDRVIVLEGTVEVHLDRSAITVERVPAGSMTETDQEG